MGKIGGAAIPLKSLGQAAELRFQRQLEESNAASFRLCIILASILFPSGIALDWITHPAQAVPLFWLRWATTGLCLLLWLAYKKWFTPKHAAHFSLAACALSAASITAMCLMLEGYQSAYYAGVNLVILCISVAFPWSTLRTALASALMIAIYLIPVSLQAGFRFEQADLLFNNLFFLTLTAVIGTTNSKLMAKLRRQSFLRLIAVEEAETELKSANQKLREYDQLKSAFFANISHELRTPLTLVLGALHRFAAQPELDGKARQSLEVARRNASLLLKHVNDLLDIAKLEASKMSLAYMEIDLAKLVRRTASLFELLAEERDIQLGIHTPEQLIAELDPHKIDRVILNLLSNAFKFTPDHSRIDITLGLEGESRQEQVRIQVEDTGPGVRPEMREAIFERFRQEESSDTRRHGGTGLGLAIAREFVEIHGGKISVSPGRSGAGACFDFWLPRHALSSQAVSASHSLTPHELAAPILDELRIELSNRRRAQSQKSFPAAHRSLGRHTVLVVEDSVDMGDYIAEILEPEYHVIRAFDGHEGLATARSALPTVILTDMMMPQMSGERMAELLAQKPETAQIPLLFLSAKADDELRIKLLQRGGSDYLTKPFLPEELLAKVEKAAELRQTHDKMKREIKAFRSDVAYLTDDLINQKRALEEAYNTVVASRNEAEKALRIRNNFLNLISHEVRNPLTVINADLYLLERTLPGEPTPDQQRIFRSIGSASGRLLELIDSILDYSQLQSQENQAVIEEFDVVKLVQDCSGGHRALAQAKSLGLEVECPPRAVSMRTDPRAIRLILSHLLGNALKYTDQGKVNVGIACLPDEWIQIQVRDSGPGIPEDQQSLIFEPFEHLEPLDSKHTPGLGLGLSLVVELVSELGGNIELDSAPGKGSVFTVKLPRKSPLHQSQAVAQCIGLKLETKADEDGASTETQV